MTRNLPTGAVQSGAFLSKTAFMRGRSCPTKLYYYLNGYPSDADQDPYLELLAQGGFMVGKMAQILFPDGVLVDTSQGLEAAFEQTKQLLAKDRVTIFEATLIAGQKSVSIDILVKEGNRFELIEVKSAAFDREEDQALRVKGGKGVFWNAKGTAIKADWQEFVDDVAYQSLVFQELFPSAALTTSLMLPDVSKRVAMDALAAQFQIERVRDGAREKIVIHFRGDAEKLRKDHFLLKRPFDEEVQYALPLVRETAQMLLESLHGGVRRIPPVRGKKCKDCEYRVGDDEPRNGFRECWGELADVKPHVFDLYFGGAIKKDGKFLLDHLIEQERVSLYDVPADSYTGIRGERQKIQVEYTRKQAEWISPELKDFLQSVRYPLHFVDFETSRLAIPMHRHMRPFDQVAFQWSCHTISTPGAAPQHSDWINTERDFPNFEFARSLRSQIGTEGTILVWAQHEQTTLKDIRDQMARFGIEDPELRNWLDLIIAGAETQGRLVDMNRLAVNYYFHPLMRGSTSLKYVLPAVWQSSADVRTAPWLMKFVKEENGALLTPYEVLPPLEIGGQQQTVKEGTGAMTAYQEMLFGESSTRPEVQEKWKALLRQYCELDTLAMVVVFRHWLNG